MEFLTRRLEGAIAGYLATYAGVGDSLNGALIREGHDSSEIADTVTDMIVATAAEAGGDLVEAGLWEMKVVLLVKTAATSTGLTRHDAWTSALAGIFDHGARQETVLSAINAFAETELKVCAWRMEQTDEGRQMEPPRHGTALTLVFEGVHVPSATT